MKTKERGITLIALVVTIIVLLILAGISIQMLTGQTGILKQAAEARDKTGRANIIEEAQRDIMEKIAEKYGEDLTADELYKILEKYFSNTPKTESGEYDDFPENFTTELESKDGKYKVKIEEIYTGNLKDDNISTGKNANVEVSMEFIGYTDGNVEYFPPEFYEKGQTVRGRINIHNTGTVKLKNINISITNAIFQENNRNTLNIELDIGENLSIDWEDYITEEESNTDKIRYIAIIQSEQMTENIKCELEAPLCCNFTMVAILVDNYLYEGSSTISSPIILKKEKLLKNITYVYDSSEDPLKDYIEYYLNKGYKYNGFYCVDADSEYWNRDNLGTYDGVDTIYVKLDKDKKVELWFSRTIGSTEPGPGEPYPDPDPDPVPTNPGPGETYPDPDPDEPDPVDPD